MTQSRLVLRNERRFGLAVFILRAEPPTKAHEANIRQALSVADTVLLCLGSANAARRPDYVPFTAQEREIMIRLMFSADENTRLRFAYIEDQNNIKQWSKIVRAQANLVEPDNKKITLIGHSKDNSSYYLKSFQGWKAVNVPNFGNNLSATTYRDHLFGGSFNPALLNDGGLHPEVQGWLIDFTKTADYDYLCEFAASVRQTVKDWGRVDPETGKRVYGPYLAADFIFVQGDHVLVIERGKHPFKGMICSPGGFVKMDEDVVEAAIREGAREETGIKLSEVAIRKTYVETESFHSPFRDPRGRVVSYASLFHNNPIPPASMTDPREIEKYLALPRLAPPKDDENDAAAAWFMPIADINRENTAFDFYTMLHRMLEHIKEA